MGGKKDMKIFRKYVVIGIIIILMGVSVIPGVSIDKFEIRQSNVNSQVKIADIHTKWDEFGLCTEVNVTCYDHNVTWSEDNLGTVRGCLMYIEWSWDILKTEMLLPRMALYYMHVLDVERGMWIPFVLPQFFIKSLWKYGEGNFSKNIYISFNTRNRVSIPLEVFVLVRGFVKSDQNNSTIIDSCVSNINVTIAK